VEIVLPDGIWGGLMVDSILARDLTLSVQGTMVVLTTLAMNIGKPPCRCLVRQCVDTADKLR